MIVGAYWEASCAQGIDGDEMNNDCFLGGSAYVFGHEPSGWIQDAYLKASNAGSNDFFGHSVSISGDKFAAGSIQEASCTDGVDSDQTDNNCASGGAVYIWNY